MLFPKKEIVDRVKAEYPAGTRVELVHMDDPYTSIPVGTKGTVSCVDDTATIHVNWETGSSLGVVYGEDTVKKLDYVKVTCYGKTEIWDNRNEARDFYREAVEGSDGSEQSRYMKILMEIMDGAKEASDEW